MTITLKLGGDVVEQAHPSLVSDLKSASARASFVIVHGGGDDVTAIAEKLGKPQSFVVSPEGIRSRFTDKETAGIYTMVMCGKTNKELVSSLQKGGLSAIGLSGLDGAIIRAVRKKKLIVVDERGRKRAIEGGYTGQIKSVNRELLLTLMQKGYVPVIAPVALGDGFEFLNVDADRAAAHVAGALGAENLILLTDVAGVLLGDKLVRKMRSQAAKKMMKEVGFGMEKKLLACIEALSMGVKRVVIASGMVENPVTKAIAEENCTVISNE